MTKPVREEVRTGFCRVFFREKEPLVKYL